MLAFSLSYGYISGPQMPKKLSQFSAAVLEGDLYTIGGLSPHVPCCGSTEQTAIHKLSCSSRVCTWTTMNQDLKVARRNLIAIPVLDSLCSPTTQTTTTTTTITTTTTTTVTTTTTSTTTTTTTTSTTTTTTNVISSKKINTNMTVFECLKARSRRIFKD